jgi:glycosyltransferase involved in cell wall biosynthesis
MKIAIVNVVGIEGSTGKIATKLADSYNKMGIECKIFHGRGQHNSSKMYYKMNVLADVIVHYLLARITKLEGYYSYFPTFLMVRQLKKYKPDYLILLNLHGHYLNIRFFMQKIAKMDVKSLYFMCDEYPYTGGCTYSNGCEEFKSECKNCPKKIYLSHKIFCDKMRYYNKLDEKIIFSSPEYIIKQAEKSTLLKDRNLSIIDTGIDTNYYSESNTDLFRKKMKINDDVIIFLDIAKYSDPRKGMHYFFEAAKHLLGNNKFLFISIGFDGDPQQVPENVIVYPYISNQTELKSLYSMADMYVCTSIDDALPNACVEALCCGTPIIAFNISGMPYVAKYPMLRLIDEVSGYELANALTNVKKKDELIMQKCRNYAVERYSFEKFSKSLFNCLTEISK